MRISYLVTVYNKLRFLPHVLAGIDAQRGDFARDLIFIDDGSTDGGGVWLDELAQARPDVIVRHQENAGPAVALNAALDLCRGDIVKLLDGDDVLLPSATATMMAALEHGGATVAFARMGANGRYDPDGPIEAALADVPPGAIEPVADMLRDCLRSAQTSPSALLATRDALAVSGGCDERVFIQDYSLELRLAATQPFVRLDGPVYREPIIKTGRLTAQPTQVLHDLNFALGRFVLSRPEIGPALARYAFKRATGRAWSFARRHLGAGLLSAPHRLDLRARFGRAGDAEDWLATLAPFVAAGGVRNPAHSAADFTA